MSDHWILTSSGKRFDLLEPRPEDVDIFDIARSLSRQCRYPGHCNGFYSVAEHSVLVSRRAPRLPYVDADRKPDIARWGLMHDAAEAYIGDIVKPLRALLPRVADIEFGIEAAIIQRFDLVVDAGIRRAIEYIDHRILVDERRRLFTMGGPEWFDVPPEPLDVDIYCHKPKIAYLVFIRRAIEVGILPEPKGEE